MVSRAFTALALVATLVSCSAEIPESSSGSSRADTSLNGNDPVVAESQPIDTSAPPESPSGAEPTAALLTPDGWGPLRIGMSRAEVVAAAGEDANPDAVGGAEPDRCDEFRPRNAPAGILVMVESGILTRISVSKNPEISTPEGLHVGDRGSSVLAEYGSRARVDPHQYWEPPAKYITVWQQASSEADRRGIRYEIDSAGEIAHLRAGGPSIEYVEGCV